MRATLTPGPGSSSNCVTTGPGFTSITSPRTPKLVYNTLKTLGFLGEAAFEIRVWACSGVRGEEIKHRRRVVGRAPAERR